MKEYIFQAKYQETMSYFDSHKLPELIRCKDCRHWGGADKNGFGACMQWHLYGVYGGDWFCADAEKKEGAQDGR